MVMGLGVPIRGPKKSLSECVYSVAFGKDHVLNSMDHVQCAISCVQDSLGSCSGT